MEQSFSPYCLLCHAYNDINGCCRADRTHTWGAQQASAGVAGPVAGSDASIKLSAHHGMQLWALVSVEDFDRVTSLEPWTVNGDAGGHRYATTIFQRGGRRVTLSMGEVVLGPAPAPGLRLSYANGNGLDNRRGNVSWATQSQVLAKRRPVGGSSRFKGVTWDRQTGKWLAAFRGKKVGRFVDEVEAGRAYDAAAFAYWGGAAYLNFPEDFANDR